MAEKYQIEPQKLFETLKKIVFKQKDGQEITNEQMISLLIVANQYNLNPFTKEIYAFPDKNNGIVPVVGVDGWIKIINTHPSFEGMEFKCSDNMIKIDERSKNCPEWMECILYLKNKSHAIVIREYLDEVYKPAFKGRNKDGNSYFIDGPWQTHTKRMLRHKTVIQASRYAFGYSGIYDKDEAEDIVKNGFKVYEQQNQYDDIQGEVKYENKVDYIKSILKNAENENHEIQKHTTEQSIKSENNTEPNFTQEKPLYDVLLEVENHKVVL
ncbi:MAG: phage recombination protein Bet [Flavobacteriaceae bacterium]|nr:MAG: phage recombination protein Bet [Flavobacteriaceae bacterium]